MIQMRVVFEMRRIGAAVTAAVVVQLNNLLYDRTTYDC